MDLDAKIAEMDKNDDNFFSTEPVASAKKKDYGKVETE